MSSKPLGRKAYGSIPHLPGSRLGSGDHHIDHGQASIATIKVRDRHDVVIVQEKLDGSNVCVAKLSDSRIVPLTRAGYLAESSPYLQHHLFSDWVYANYDRFDNLLNLEERVCGEWLALAHGTKYKLVHEPFVVFDLFDASNKRLSYWDIGSRIAGRFIPARTLKWSPAKAVPLDEALNLLSVQCFDEPNHGAIDPIEGVVYRVERKGNVEFLCKYVRPDKVDGCYLKDYTGVDIWNEDLEQWLSKKALNKLKFHIEHSCTSP